MIDVLDVLIDSSPALSKIQYLPVFVTHTGAAHVMSG